MFNLIFLGGRLPSRVSGPTEWNRANRGRDTLRVLSRELGYSFITYYHLNQANRIAELCGKYESEDGSNRASIQEVRRRKIVSSRRPGLGATWASPEFNLACRGQAPELVTNINQFL